VTKFIDCITYFDEDLPLDIRFHELNDFIDYFVIVESNQTHQGNYKKLNFDISKFKKFKDKIIYLVIENLEDDLFKSKNEKYLFNTLDWKREHAQRNFILKGIQKFSDNDCILISDADEIPRGELIKKNFSNLNTFYSFRQSLYFYKINLLVKKKWHGTVMTAKKNLGKLVSPSNARIIKTPKRSGIRGFFYNVKHRIKVVNNGGWHFSYLKSPENILVKLESFAHKEHNNNQTKNLKHIESSIERGENFFSNQRFKKVEIDKSYPNYILKNLDKFNPWIKN
jgi:beta-1,4-mannosyl-glycoprotein beta-1,4-N-acetylglucosaminyltransferase